MAGVDSETGERVCAKINHNDEYEGSAAQKKEIMHHMALKHGTHSPHRRLLLALLQAVRMVLRTENIVELKDVLKAVPPGARDGKKRLIIVMEILQGVRDPPGPSLLLVPIFVISSSQGLSAEHGGWLLVAG